MKRKNLYQQILVAFGVLVFFIIGLAIGSITSPSRQKNNEEKKSDYELTVMNVKVQDSTSSTRE